MSLQTDNLLYININTNENTGVKFIIKNLVILRVVNPSLFSYHLYIQSKVPAVHESYGEE